MPIIKQFIELTLEELQLLVQNEGSSSVVSDPLERFIIYSTVSAQQEGRTINIKYIQAKSHRSFYRCNKAVKKLIKNGWISERTNQKDKRNKDLIAKQISITLVRDYESAKAGSLIKKGVKLGKPQSKLTLTDMLDKNEAQLVKMKEDLLRKKS